MAEDSMLMPDHDLRWATFEFILEFLESAFFDEFIGAVLRSALGYALRETTNLSTYRYLFETPPTRPLQDLGRGPDVHGVLTRAVNAP